MDKDSSTKILIILLFYLLVLTYGISILGPTSVAICVALYYGIISLRERKIAPWQYWVIPIFFIYGSAPLISQYGPIRWVGILITGFIFGFLILLIFSMPVVWLSYIKFQKNPDQKAFIKHDIFNRIPEGYTLSFFFLLTGDGNFKVSPDMQLREILNLKQCYYSFRELLAAYFHHPAHECTDDEINSISHLALGEFIVLCFYQGIEPDDYDW